MTRWYEGRHPCGLRAQCFLSRQVSTRAFTVEAAPAIPTRERIMTKRKTHIVLWLLFAGVPLVVAGVIIAFFLLRSGSGPKDTGPNLFIMQRSVNANEVHYDVQAGADGALADEPVVAYWVMKAEGGGREDLTFFEEEMAYGFEVLEADGN